jgi:O-antigen/teichoic acid export membrane protein
MLSQADYARFTVSISFVAIIALVADLGMNPLFTRLFAEAEEEVNSNGEDRRGIILGSALGIRIALSVIVAGLVILIAPMLYPESMVHDMAILLIALLISSRLMVVRSVGDAILRGWGKYHLSALFGLFDAVAFALLMILSAYRHFNLDQVIWVYVLCNIPGFIMLVRAIFLWARREHLTLGFDLRLAHSMLKLSIPLALGTAFLTIHSQIDNILLYKLSTPLEVSSFGATMRLSTAMAPFSLVLAAVTAPELSRLLLLEDHLRAKQLTDISLRLLIVIGVAIALFVTSLSGIIVPLILGAKYTSASPLLIWTGWMLVPIFVATLLMEVSVAAGYSWFMTTFAAIAMVAVIVGDMIFIPSLGAMGAMASKLIAVTLGAGTMIVLSRNTGHLDSRRFTSAFIRTGLAAGTAIGTLLLLRALFLGEILSTLIVLTIYFLVIHFSQVLPLAEVVGLLKRIRNPISITNE